MPDHYTLLGVARFATTQEIKAVYRRLIAQYHPDLNPAPQASEITARLNEAYAVLSDEGRRKIYDAELDATAPLGTASAGFARDAAAASLSAAHCQDCGRQDSTLRISQFSYAISFLFFTRSRSVKGIWCETCRAVESAKWTFLSGFAGWWGIPWGPVRTIQALVVNCRGGRQSARGNSALLRSLGYEFYGRGSYKEAARSLRESLRFRQDPEAKALFNQLQTRFGFPDKSSVPSPWTLALGVPVLILAVVWGGLMVAAASRLAAYRASHPTLSDLAINSPAAPSGAAESVRDSVHLQIQQLASVIAHRSPRLGAHYQGSALVEDYALDRSRYDAAQLYPIAQSIGKEFQPNTPDPQGFLASAYFNSMLFALSVDLVNRVYRGRPIQSQIAQAVALGNDPRVSGWLRAGRFWRDYQALQTVLQASAQSYHPGQPLEQMETRAELLQSTLQQLESRQSLFQAEDNIPGYNHLVPVYNRDLAKLKSLSSQIEAQLAFARKLDQAFNRCLDGSILFSKIERVDFTSEASKTNGSP